MKLSYAFLIYSFVMSYSIVVSLDIEIIEIYCLMIGLQAENYLHFAVTSMSMSAVLELTSSFSVGCVKLPVFRLLTVERLLSSQIMI